MAMLVIAASPFHEQRARPSVTTSTRSPHALARARSGRRRVAVRRRAARLRPVLVERRHDGRPGRDAGLHRPADPALRPAPGRRWRRRSSCSRIGVDPSRALVLSQVVLSFGIPFALVPLILLRRADVMGALVNRASRRSPPASSPRDHRAERLPAGRDVRHRERLTSSERSVRRCTAFVDSQTAVLRVRDERATAEPLGPQ